MAVTTVSPGRSGILLPDSAREEDVQAGKESGAEAGRCAASAGSLAARLRRSRSQRSRQFVQVVRFVSLPDFVGLLLGAVADVNATAHNRQNDQQNENQKTYQDLHQYAAALRGGLGQRLGRQREPEEVEAGRRLAPAAGTQSQAHGPGGRHICRRSCLRQPAIRIVRKTA